MNREISEKDVEDLYEKIRTEAATSGYFLNPDQEFAKDLVRSLLINFDRYGYQSCPCRLAAGNQGEDNDIICPCDYRDPDVVEFGACFCALYVSQAVAKGKRDVTSIPERRLPSEKRTNTVGITQKPLTELSHPVWRCKVCGYLCARNEPPDVCPICKVKKDRFERFM
jgi:ferredoxin-thioredoxin reductase catalytic subunit